MVFSIGAEFREGRSKSVVVPVTIDTVRKLIFQDRHGTNREIETTIGIRETSIRVYSIFPKHLTVKKICSSWIPQNLSNDSNASKHF